MNVPIFDDVIIFQLDENPVITRVDQKQWKLHVKNDENWKVFGACKILWEHCKQYKTAKEELQVQIKKDDDEEDSESIALQLRCEFLSNRIQYLFNFIMNYRSRYSHNIKNRKNKFLLEEHFESYNQLCDKLKEAKALMDKM